MLAADALAELIRPTIEGLGYELWGVERQRAGRRYVLRVYIDAEAGIAVEDCERVSRQIGDLLEVEDAIQDDYVLEVSSPGLDRVLFQPSQWRRFVGDNVRLQLRIPSAGQRRLTGRLVSADEDDVRIAAADGEHTVRYTTIERARLVPTWPDAGADKKRRKKHLGDNR